MASEDLVELSGVGDNKETTDSQPPIYKRPVDAYRKSKVETRMAKREAFRLRFTAVNNAQQAANKELGNVLDMIK